MSQWKHEGLARGSRGYLDEHIRPFLDDGEGSMTQQQQLGGFVDQQASSSFLPSTSCTSLLSMMSYALFYFRNVFTIHELIVLHLLSAMCGGPDRESSFDQVVDEASSETIRDEKDPVPLSVRIQRAEIAFRLLSRKPSYFPVSKLEASYGNAVNDAIEILSSQTQIIVTSVPGSTSEAAVGSPLAEVISGAHLADWIARGLAADAALPMRCLNVKDLREILVSMARQCGKRLVPGTGRGSGSGSAAAEGLPQTDEDSGAKRSGSGSGSDKLIVFPRTKEDLISTVIDLAKHGGACDALRQAWDAIVGEILSVNRNAKQVVQLVAALFYTATELGSGGAVGSTTATPPMPTSNAALLSAMGLIKFPLKGILPDFAPLIPTGIKQGVLQTTGDEEHRGEGSSNVIFPMYLISSREELELLMAALTLRMELFDACEGFDKFRRGRDPARIKLWFEQARQLLKESAVITRHTEKQQQTAQKSRKRVRSERGESMEGGDDADQQNFPPTVVSLLRARGSDVSHLLRFLPAYHVFSCLQYVAELLEFQKEYASAADIYTHLLEVPLHKVEFVEPKTGVVAVTYNFWFRPQKRGHFWFRRLQTMCHLGHEKEALDLAEEVLSKCTSAAHAAATTSHQAERCIRLSTGPTTGWSRLEAVRHLTNEVASRFFLRRADRLAVERVLLRLHKPPRRWCPAPSNMISSTLLRNEHHVFLHAKREDVSGRSLWSDGVRPCVNVEDFALNWYQAGRGRKERGWEGMHCEGRWFSLLFHLCFFDALYDVNATHCNCSDDNNEPSAPPFVWLSPFQQDPLDLTVPQQFVARRRAVVESILSKLESCSREEFVKLIMSRVIIGADAKRSSDDPFDQEESSDEEGEGGGTEQTEERVSKATDVAAGKGEEELATGGDDDDDDDDDEEEPAILARPVAAGSSSYGVNVGTFPILELALAVPRPQLCALFRIFLLSPSWEGYTIRFSGFPDLVVWRNLSMVEKGAGDPPVVASDPSTWPTVGDFRVCEVKSPSDSLSDKQLVIMDAMQRVGFTVDVAQIVVDSSSDAKASIINCTDDQAAATVMAMKRRTSNGHGSLKRHTAVERENAAKKIVPRQQGIGSVLLPICPD